MAKRKTSKRIPSEAVQGEGSYVELRSLKWKEVKELRKKLEAASDEEKAELNTQVIAQVVVGWNWVGDDDKPLPLPSDEPAILDELTADEITWLGEAMQQGGDDPKK